MKISYNWLKQYLVSELEVHEICRILTDIGLEVESSQECKTSNPFLQSVVLGKIISCVIHPNASNLQLIQVDVGEPQELQIVCGVNNVAENQKVLVALVGAFLLNERDGHLIRVRKTRIKGVISQGVICSAKEVALWKKPEGILLVNSQAPAGAPASDVFPENKDYIIEITLTPNRADAMGHWGVARDLHAALKARGYKSQLRKPSVDEFVSKEKKKSFSVHIEDLNRCIRYSACLITQVKITPSPLWLREYLELVGVHSVNNIVDVIHFVMYELGQPLHVYDADSIEGEEIYIRAPRVRESIKTIDSSELSLDHRDIIVSDTQKPLCLAGVLGGVDSSITEKTRNILLESACFDPISVRKSAKRHGLSTESSFRFERRVDPEQVLYSLKRAALLIKEIAQGKLSDPIDLYPNPVKGTQIELRYQKIDRLLGQRLPKRQIKKILSLLEIDILFQKKEGLKVCVPTYRVDVVREVDLIEEILRIYGYNLIQTPENFCFSLTPPTLDAQELEERSSKLLNAQGFYEVINLSLTQKKYQKFIENSSCQAIDLLNPLSDELSVLRQSLLFGLLERLSYNIGRKNTSLKLFEWGKVYNKEKGKYLECTHLSFISTDKKTQKVHWFSSEDTFSFFKLKGILEILLRKNRVLDFTQRLIRHPLLHQGLLLVYKEKPLAFTGGVKKEILEHFGIDQQVFYADVRWEYLIKIFQQSKVRIQLPPKYPRVRRDLSIMLDEAVTFEDLRENIRKTEQKLLKSTRLFDVYQGKKLPKGKKSYAISFHLEDPERTLTDDRIEEVMENIRRVLRETLGAEFR